VTTSTMQVHRSSSGVESCGGSAQKAPHTTQARFLSKKRILNCWNFLCKQFYISSENNSFLRLFNHKGPHTLQRIERQKIVVSESVNKYINF